MNGPADIGGDHFGPVIPEADEPVFHADWEREVFAITLAMGATGLWTLDRSRLMRETLPHAQYYASSYYEIWFAALERLVEETGAAEGRATPVRVLRREDVRATLGRGGPSARPGPAPRYAVGDTVRVRPMRPEGHTRAPAYVRGRTGRIARIYGSHVFPDTSAHRLGENPQPLYNVSFAARELWGEDTTAANVNVDLFEPYLEPVAPGREG